MKRTTAMLTLLAALVLVAQAAASAHGFRDTRAPQEAARILNALPNVDGMACHWKQARRTIGCVGLFRGATAQLLIWSGGPGRVMYHVCQGGACGPSVKAAHVFGRPY